MLVLLGAGALNAPSLPIYLFLAFQAFRGPEERFRVLILLFLLNLGNKVFFPGSDLFGRWLVLFSVAVASLLGRAPRLPSVFKIVLVLFVVELTIVTPLTSQLPSLSLLKGVALSMLLLAVFWTLPAVKNAGSGDQIFDTAWMFILSLSLFALLVGVGYERNGIGFQGALGHPQLFGPFCAIGAVKFASAAYFERVRVPLLYSATSLVFVVFMFMSGSRTAALSLGIGCIAVLLFGVTLRKSRGRIFKATIAVFVICVCSLPLFALLGDTGVITAFFVKGKAVDSPQLVGILMESRGALIDASFRNFRDFPIFGIGLGVPTDFKSGELARSIVRIAGIPVSATVEKGFQPTAILEELGIVGALFVSMLLVSIAIYVTLRGAPQQIWLLYTALAFNAGEAVLLSAGGMGLLVWLVIAFSFAGDSAAYSRGKSLQAHAHAKR